MVLEVRIEVTFGEWGQASGAGHKGGFRSDYMDGSLIAVVSRYLFRKLIINGIFFFKYFLGLSWWHNGYKSTCQCRDHGFNPCSEKILRAVEHKPVWHSY